MMNYARLLHESQAMCKTMQTFKHEYSKKSILLIDLLHVIILV